MIFVDDLLWLAKQQGDVARIMNHDGDFLARPARRPFLLEEVHRWPGVSPVVRIPGTLQQLLHRRGLKGQDSILPSAKEEASCSTSNDLQSKLSNSSPSSSTNRKELQSLDRVFLAVR